MTQDQINKIRENAIVEKCSENEYVACYGDYTGYGDTEFDAVTQLIIGMEFEEAELND